MAHDWHDRPATALPRSHCHRLRVLNPTVLLSCLLLLIVFHFPSTTTAIQSVPGSPCESVCRDAGSIEDDVVCLDANYQSLGAGRAFQTCVACQLNSTAVDTANNQTDVEWGLRMSYQIYSGRAGDKYTEPMVFSSGSTVHAFRMHVSYPLLDHLTGT